MYVLIAYCVVMCVISIDMYHPLPPNSLDTFSDTFDRMASLDFSHTMNHILFNKTVLSQLGAHPFLSFYLTPTCPKSKYEIFFSVFLTM